ncbi:type II toxin-antitoxin system RelE/ParE family toxin [Candidatus Woesearchaeota archaeon]|nr:type II toxin-antitoxin system RelE/ParE family toxin [Candidatus Woesearchaeota archaeon]
MNTIEIKEDFFKSLKIVKDNSTLKTIHQKIEQLKDRCPVGKKLVNSPYWSIRIDRYRIIYRFKGDKVTIIRLLPRKYSYRELGTLE